ncbi:MAG: acyl-CoA dehydrogenase [Syntrophales bacterium]|nr:acyl-CoA dehydrogenase [Syntrophales bacterium]
MADKFISMRNLQFLLYEHLDSVALTQYPYFADHSRETFDMVLETAMRMGRGILFPALAEMDKHPPEFREGKVFVHPVVAIVMKACGDGGWIGAQAPYELGGQQIPNTIMTAFRGIFSAANYSASVYPFLTTGAAHLILAFGAKELVDAYVPKMFAGQWQGTMALTEPQAGSSLTDLKTTAFPTEEGYFKIKGQKIFISCSDYESTGNIVNLLLARIDGAPPGIKGISLFVVPKKRPDGHGSLVGNDVTCIGIYHKLGYRGAPITQLAFGDSDDCRGWLVGEPHKGLRYMFQMMNEARVDVGMGAAAIASAAYCASLEYTRQRPQGRPVAGKDPLAPQVPIIEHADVKRMLLFQRAVVEGSLALLFQCARYVDLALVTAGEEKEKCELLLDLLTPVAKSYPSEMGILSVSQGLQCLGGYGYCDEFPLEQYYRDIRIHPIHEGTTGIQSMDLLGRKIVMQNGKAFFLYLAELEKAVAAGRAIPDCAHSAEALAGAVERLKEVTASLTGLAMKGEIELFLADATLYLELFGTIAIAWQWLLQAVTAAKTLAAAPAIDADFYRGKIHTGRYFFAYELPKIHGLAARLKESGDGLTVAMKPEWFE